MKRLYPLILAVALLVNLAIPAFAASDEATNAADRLYSLGLFSGTGTDADGKPIYDLDRAPTRQEAITMLVGLLGKKGEALNGTWDIPFTDVADWAKPFVGYAYANGLTSGTSATTFGGNDLVSAAQYLTFVLKVLGYEAGKDFQWDKAWELSDAIGLTCGEYHGENLSFQRGNVAMISQKALTTSIKGTNLTLAQKLLEDGSVELGSLLLNGIVPDRQIVTYDIAPNKDGEYWLRREELQTVFPNMQDFHADDYQPTFTSVDDYLILSEQMMALVASKGREGAWRGVQYYTGNPPKTLLLHSAPTTLCGFSIGTPERLKDGTDRYTVVLCDYDFKQIYEQREKEFEEAIDWPYIDHDDLETCGAVSFIGGYQMEVTFDDYWTRVQLYHVWNLFNSDNAYAYVQPFDHLENDIAYWMNYEEKYAVKMGRLYLLLDETKQPIGYTIFERK